MANQKEVESGAKLAKKIKKHIDMGEKIDKDKLLEQLDNLFFNTYSDPSAYTFASKALDNVGVRNKVGEEDSFGPLSWGVQLPHNNEWVYFG